MLLIAVMFRPLSAYWTDMIEDIREDNRYYCQIQFNNLYIMATPSASAAPPPLVSDASPARGLPTRACETHL